MFHPVKVAADTAHYVSGGRQTSSTKRYGAFEEYWYDAFGRRIFKLSRQESPVCTIASRCKTSADRYVWDGDQLLYEVRRNSVSDFSGLPTSDNFQGRTLYVHAGPVDEPVAVIRNGVAYRLHYTTTVGCRRSRLR